MKHIEMYVDGGASPNPGTGAHAAFLLYGDPGAQHTRMVSGTAENVTNNQMEIQAVIAGLEALKEGCEVTVYSDSQYVVNCGSGQSRRSANVEWWAKYDLAQQRHVVSFVWQRGHNGNPGNERCHAEVERLLRVRQANELVNAGERLSDDDWITQTKAAHKMRRQEMGLEE